MTRQDYINDNDFEGALHRFETTNIRWKKHWWAALEEIYSKVKTLARKYILDAENMIVKVVKQVADTIISLVNNGDEEGEKVYLFKFYDEEGNLQFSKVGTTIRKVSQRLKEEIRSYRKNFSIGYAVIESVFNCGDLPAEGAESYCRAKFIKQYPHTFQKNDRFMGIDIPVDDFNDAVKSYLAQGWLFSRAVRYFA